MRKKYMYVVLYDGILCYLSKVLKADEERCLLCLPSLYCLPAALFPSRALALSAIWRTIPKTRAVRKCYKIVKCERFEDSI